MGGLRRAAVVLALVTSAAACASRPNLVLKSPALRGDTFVVRSWHPLFGLVPVSVRAPDCPAGLARVEWPRFPWWNFAVVLPTLGLLSATDTRFTCAETDDPAPEPDKTRPAAGRRR
jgi:hypothetical protein